jgi:histidinol-phosphatase (PHP family)
VEKAKTAEPVLAFFDIMMPKMNGFEAAGNLRSLGYKLPIIAVTATFLPEDEEKCKESGINDVLTKPIKFSEIKMTLEKWLIPGKEPRAFDLVPAGPAASTVSGPEIFNAEEMLSAFLNETEVVLPLLSRFIERTGSQLGNFPVLKAAGEWTTARRYAHTIKGAAFTMGSAELGKAASALEKACINASAEEAETAYPHVLETFEEYKQEAEKFICDKSGNYVKTAMPKIMISLACIHTHTVFCDGKDDIETFCRTAYEKGLQSLGFSAHAPVFAKTGLRTAWHLPDERPGEYLDSVRSAKKRWEGRLPVYLGLEVDFIPGITGPADKDYREMGLDYIIASVHYVLPPRGKPFTVDGPPEEVEQGIKEGFGGDPMGMVESYLDSEEAMIRTGGFDVLGHPDLVKLHNKDNKFFNPKSDFYLKRIAALSALLAEAGVPSELNTGGINRDKISECYPSVDFLKHFRSQNVPIVINADAHRAAELDGHYEDARKIMLEAGYTETVIFEGRVEGKAVWKSEKL